MLVSMNLMSRGLYYFPLRTGVAGLSTVFATTK